MHFANKISVNPFPGLRVKTFPVLAVLFFLTLQEAFPQITDDFADGDLTKAPPWLGTYGQFIVNSNYQLQLNAVAAGTSWLSTQIPFRETKLMEWKFLLK